MNVFVRLAVSISASLGLAGTASANLILNGSFELTGGADVQGWGGYTYGVGYSPTLPYWQVNSGSVDIVPEIGSWKPAYEGDHSLDLVGFTQGSISQSFSTVLNAPYTLSFFYSKNVANSPNPSKALVTLEGTGFTTWSQEIVVSNAQAGVAGAMNWLASTPHSFVGTGNDIKLTFSATNGAANGGVFIDAVAVVPEPEAYGLALAGMGVVAFALRRRKVDC